MVRLLAVLLMLPMVCKAVPSFRIPGAAASVVPYRTVLCIGDSLTDFGSATIISWCDQSRFATTNIAVSGTSTSHWIANYAAYTAGVTVSEFDTVVVVLGYNDANVGEDPVTANQFTTNMGVILNALEGDGATDIMLVGPPHKVSDANPRTLETNASIDVYVERLVDIAAARASSRHSLALSVNHLGYPGFYEDPNHPTTAGQAIWKLWFDGAIPH